MFVRPGPFASKIVLRQMYIYVESESRYRILFARAFRGRYVTEVTMSERVRGVR